MIEMAPVFLGGKTLRELNFPKDWFYETDMMRWRSEKHFLMVTPKKTGNKEGKPYKQYLYITDDMLMSTRI